MRRKPRASRKLRVRRKRRSGSHAVGFVMRSKTRFPGCRKSSTARKLERALGFTPCRSSVVRILKDLWSEKTLEIVGFSGGRRPTKYRKVAGPG